MANTNTLTPNLKLAPAVVLSPTLAADAQVQKLRAAGREIFHMGFGQAPFPVLPRMLKAIQHHAHEKAYLPVAGLPELRTAVARHQQRLLGTDVDGVDTLIAPGSKLIIYAVQMVVAGDLLLPTPSWVSYAPQATMLGQAVIPVVTTLSENGILIDAEELEKTILSSRKSGKNPTKLLLNYPSNPTGLTLSPRTLGAIADVCIKHNVCIISDEIYGRLTFEGGYRSISEFAPNHTVVTTGLSKHLSLGGWRLGVGVIPKAIQGLFSALSGVASETWSCVAAPIQMAAIEAYEGHDDIETFIHDCTAIHAAVTRYVASELRAIGVPCFNAQGGFYVWPNFNSIGKNTEPQTSAELANHLLEKAGIVALPGTAFGERPSELKLRLSTCDYDGQEALDYLKNNGNTVNDDDVIKFAPRLAGAIKGFDRMVNSS